MKDRFLLIVLFFVIFSCNKATPVVHLPSDFTFIPTKNATWKMHTQGIYFPLPHAWPNDTSWHFYNTINARGTDTQINNYTYYQYDVSYVLMNTVDSTKNDSKNSLLLIREDTVNQKVYGIWVGGSAHCTGEYLAVDYSLQVGMNVPYDTAALNKESVYLNHIGFLFSTNTYFKRWDYSTNKLYQAYGIGNSWSCILPAVYEVCGNYGKMVSIDFRYKTDSVHLVL